MNQLLLENNTKDNMQLTVINDKQKSFLETALGKAINSAINYGLKKLLPDFIEDQIIEIKDEIFNNGIKDGLKVISNKISDLAQSAIGTISGKFNNISQIEMAVEKGGIIDSASKLLDKGIKNIEEKNIFSEDITSTIKQGKNVIKNDLRKNIKLTLDEQKVLLNKIDKCYDNWKVAYEQKDINKMEVEYNKIKEKLEKIIPIEDINKKITEIENINNLIKNNGENFNLSKLEFELAKKL